MIFLLICLIVIILVLSKKLKNANQKNEQLNKKINEFNNNTSENISQHFENIQENLVIEHTNKDNEEEVILDNNKPQTNNMQNYITNINNSYNNMNNNVEKDIIDNQKNKNKLILISGSILIVLSAIVFLLSTWNTTPDVIKTGVLFLLIGVFMGGSKIAEKNDLFQTSKAFYNIAMAYIPIVLFSISVFKFLGEYLSISGEGKYIYFSLSSIFLAMLYHFESRRKKSNTIVVFSIVFQILSVIFTFLIISENVSLIILGLLIYNIVLSYIVNHAKLEELENIYKAFIRINYILLFIATFVVAIPDWIKTSCTFIHILNFIFLIINGFTTKINGNKIRALTNLNLLAIILTAVNIENTELLFGNKLLAVTASIMILYFINYALTKEIKYKIIAYISINFVFLAVFQIMGALESAKYIPFFSTIIAIAIEEYKSDKGIESYIILSFLASFIGLNIDITMFSLLLLVSSIIINMYYINYKKMDEEYNVIPMLSIIPSIYISDILISSSGFNYGLVASIIIILLTSARSVLSEKSNIYTIMSIIYLFLSIFTFSMNIYITLILILVWAVLHIITNEQNDFFKVIAYIASLLLYNNLINDIGLGGVTIIKTLGYLVCILLISRTIIKKLEGPYEALEAIAIGFVYLYALLTYSSISDGILFTIFLTMITCMSYYKKVYLIYAVSVVAIALMYNKILIDISFEGYTIIRLIGFIACTYLITRLFLKKLGLSYKNAEYFFTSLIFLYALYNYTSITDAMVFIFAMLVMVILGYFNKIGPMFLVSLIGVVVNIFELTKEFWYSIPWWVYMCMVGLGLLTFAVRNEASERNDNSYMKEAINRFKNRIDM